MKNNYESGAYAQFLHYAGGRLGFFYDGLTNYCEAWEHETGDACPISREKVAAVREAIGEMIDIIGRELGKTIEACEAAGLSTGLPEHVVALVKVAGLLEGLITKPKGGADIKVATAQASAEIDELYRLFGKEPGKGPVN